MPRYISINKSPTGVKRIGVSTFGSGVKRIMPTKPRSHRKKEPLSSLSKGRSKGRPKHSYVLY